MHTYSSEQQKKKSCSAGLPEIYIQYKKNARQSVNFSDGLIINIFYLQTHTHTHKHTRN